MSNNTGTKCEGTQAFLTEILTTGSGRVTVLGTSKTGVALTSYFEVKSNVGFQDYADLRALIADAFNAGNTEEGLRLLSDVISDSEEVAWGDLAFCYQVHVGCDCSPEQRDVEYSDLPAGCPECEMIGSWSPITDEVWYCEACGHQSDDVDGDDAPVSTDLV